MAWPGSRWPFCIPKVLWPVPCAVTLCQVPLFPKTIFPDLLGNTCKEVGAGDGCRLITVPPPYTLRPGICCSQSHTACQVTKLHQTELCSASQMSWPPQSQPLSLPQCCLSAFLPSAWPLSSEEGMCHGRPGPSSLLSSSPCFCLSTQHLSNPSVGSCRHARLAGYSSSIWLSPKGKTLPKLRGVRQQGRPHRVPAPSDSSTWLPR